MYKLIQNSKFYFKCEYFVFSCKFLCSVFKAYKYCSFFIKLLDVIRRGSSQNLKNIYGYSECLYYPLPFNATQIDNPFLTSRISVGVSSQL